MGLQMNQSWIGYQKLMSDLNIEAQTDIYNLPSSF